MPKKSRVPLKKWAADRYNAYPVYTGGPRMYALSIMRYATIPYRPKGGRDPFNDSQRMHLDRWHFESMAPSAGKITQAYQDLLAEWYGEKEPPK